MCFWKIQRSRKDKRLERSFGKLFVRLSHPERQRVAQGLAQPFRRRWFVVDALGVRELDE
jgi:hypothetical protein